MSKKYSNKIIFTWNEACEKTRSTGTLVAGESKNDFAAFSNRLKI